ncbi:MAG: DUF2284 domain-containing protein [Firmicutes bacterium]|nr:DUF2284 domain-containing protein [Bacillota bacterium]
MLKERLLWAFQEIGFDEYKELETHELVFSEDVFNQCAKNICGNFNKNHACPPRAGSVEERKARILNYKKGFLLSKFASIRTREEMETSMQEVFEAIKKLRSIFTNDDVLILGAGPCTVCKRCTALDDKPCRFPDKIQYSMEGCGIDVVRMSLQKEMRYNPGRGKIAYFTLVVYND